MAEGATFNVLWLNYNGKENKKDIYIKVNYCIAEINTTLQINYTWIIF